LAEKNASSTRKHEERDDLAGEYIWGDLGQIILLLIFLTVWVLDSFVFKFSTFLSSYVPIYIKIVLATFFFFVSGFLARKGLKLIFGKTRTKPGVVKEGVFGIVRHPIYLGAILLYLSLWVLSLSLIVLLIWIVIVTFYYFISKYEEKLLLGRFGKDYVEYQKDVPMLFPRIIK
jgi:protein-S-isoprenylcysteine O-methyltransferase Ste14